MRMNGKKILGAGRTILLAALAACSDGATAPSAAVRVPKVGFAVTVPAVTLGQITVCKDGNVGGTFSVSRADVGGAHGGVSPATTSSPTIATGTCSVVAVDPSTIVEVGSNVTITENAAANTVSTITGCRFLAAGGVEQDCANFNANPRFINAYHGYVITYTNTFTPPPPPPPAVCDFSTFGGFTLENNFNISYGGNAGAIDDGTAYGDLEFVNHTTGDKIHVWNVTGYGHPASGPLSSYPDSRFASGMGEINGSGSFPVEFRFVDLGEPGTSDRVWLKVNGSVLIAEQVVQGGNVQLHDICKKAPKAEKH